MKREETDQRSTGPQHEPEISPVTKPPHKFTGQGFEIIGDPTGESGGEFYFRDGKCRSIHCSEPPILTPEDAKGRMPNLAERVAWFILSRDHANPDSPGNPDDPERQRREARERRGACLFAPGIIDEIINGTILSFSQRVERAIEAIHEEKREHDSPRTKEDGYRSALLIVANQCRHPDEVTVSAVADYLRDNPEFCTEYKIRDKEQRGVRRRLEQIGFGWIPAGRGKGRPKK